MTYGGAAERYATIPHAIDPEDLGGPAAAREDGLFRMIYAGSLYGAEEAEAYFDVLLRAFGALRENHPSAFARCRLDLHITGHGTADYERKVHAQGFDGHIRFQPQLPPQEIFRRIRQANLVLTFIPRVNKDILGTKFNEIFMLRRPVLHVGEPGLVSRTIVGRRLGASLRVEELVQELPRIISGERVMEIDLEADHDEHLLSAVTDRLIGEALV
jgi:hypothetical protein